MDGVPALDEPLKKVLGGTTAKVMAEHLGLHTVGDLLHHYPRRYEERGELTRLADLPLDEHVTVVAQVADARVHKFNRRPARASAWRSTITDGSGRLQLVFFGRGVHKPHKELLPGTPRDVRGQGLASSTAASNWPTPRTSCCGADDAATEAVDAFAGALMPIYPAMRADWSPGRSPRPSRRCCPEATG